MSKKKRSSFRGKVKKDSQRGVGYGYLNLPKGVKVFNPDSVTVKLDFMPYEVTDKKHPDRNVEDEIAVPGSLWYKRPFKIHRNIGVDNDKVVCLSSIGKACPICEKRSELIRQDADKEDTDALKQSLRNLYVVIPLDAKKYDAEPHIMDMSYYLCQEEIKKTIDEDEDYEVFPDLEEGLTMRCRFDEAQIGKTKFVELGKVTPIKREEQYTEDILDDIPNLDEVLNILSYKELEAKFLELDEEDTTDDGSLDDVQPPKTERSRSRTKTNKPEKEEEPEETEREKKRRERKGKKDKEETGTDDNRCSHGHEFGKDCDEYPDDCKDCNEWDDCGEEQDKLK